MTHEEVRTLKFGNFKRLCRVIKIFLTMCEIVSEHNQSNERDRKSKLAIEEQVLLTLNFWREYEVVFHLK